MFTLVNDGLTTSLRDRCLQYLANNSSLLTLENMKALPLEILDDLQWYLCAHDLLKFENFFNTCGINTNSAWEQHLYNRFKSEFLYHTFRQKRRPVIEGSRCDTAEALYMKLHCSQMLFPILSKVKEERPCKDVCYHGLIFYLQYTPYLMLTVPRGLDIDNDKTLNILHVIKTHVQHVDIKQRGKLDVSDTVIGLIRYLRSESGVTSLGIFMTQYSETFKERLYRELSNTDYTLQTLEGVETNVEQYCKDYFTDRHAFKGIRRLGVKLSRSISSTDLVNGLRHLTHLSIEAKSVDFDCIIRALAMFHRDPLIEPLKYLGFSGLDIDITMSSDEILGLSYAVEEMYIDDCEFIDGLKSKTRFVLFLQRGRCLRRLHMLDYPYDDINTPGLNQLWETVWSNSDLQSLTSPAEKLFQQGLCSMIQLSQNLTYLRIEWHPQWDQAVVTSAYDALKSLKQLKTLDLNYNPIGGYVISILTSIYISREFPALRNLNISTCSVNGVDLISVGKLIRESRDKHGHKHRRKLHVLDMTCNRINRSQQKGIYQLYKDLTDILVIDIADRSLAFSDV